MILATAFPGRRDSGAWLRPVGIAMVTVSVFLLPASSGLVRDLDAQLGHLGAGDLFRRDSGGPGATPPFAVAAARTLLDDLAGGNLVAALLDSVRLAPLLACIAWTAILVRSRLGAAPRRAAWWAAGTLSLAAAAAAAAIALAERRAGALLPGWELGIPLLLCLVPALLPRRGFGSRDPGAVVSAQALSGLLFAGLVLFAPGLRPWPPAWRTSLSAIRILEAGTSPPVLLLVVGLALVALPPHLRPAPAPAPEPGAPALRP